MFLNYHVSGNVELFGEGRETDWQVGELPMRAINLNSVRSSAFFAFAGKFASASGRPLATLGIDNL